MSQGVIEMLKKALAALIASAMLATISATALAMPDETPAPEETAMPSDTTAPAPTATPIDPAVFTEQVKVMIAEVIALRQQLQDEKQLDQKLRSEIASLKDIYKPDLAQVKAYRDEAKALDTQLRQLNRQLKEALQGEGKGKDKVINQQLVAEIQANIANVKAQIAAMEEKYAALKVQIKANNSARSTLKAFRTQLKVEYAKLKPLFQVSIVLKEQMYALIDQLKAAITAGDIVTASDLLAQITAKVDALKDNINQRIAIRNGITQMLEDYKASLTQ
jgi:chromosome segregation ATPase